MALLQLTLPPLLGWRCLPFGAAKIRTVFSCFNKFRKRQQKSAPKKYPILLGNVSKDKSPSILASFFSLPCRSPARRVVGLGAQACLGRKGVESYRTARTFPRLFPQSTDARAYEYDKDRKPAGFLPLYCVVWPSPWPAAELTWPFGRGEETLGFFPTALT